MAKVTVYECGVYDVTTDTFMKSKRLATKEAAASYRLAIVEDTGMEVDESEVGTEIPGMTKKQTKPGFFS